MYGKLTPGCLALCTSKRNAGKVVTCLKFVGQLHARVQAKCGEVISVSSESSQVWEVDTYLSWRNLKNDRTHDIPYATAEYLIPLNGDGVQLDVTATDTPVKT